jgi:hypothetical protein
MKNMKIKDYESFVTGQYDILNIQHLIESKGIPNWIKYKVNEIIQKVEDNKYDNVLNVDELDYPLHIQIGHYNIPQATASFNSKSKIFEIKINTVKCISLEEIKRNLSHELLHIHELNHRIKNNVTKKLQWDLNLNLSKLKSYRSDPFLNFFMTFLYFTLDHEINARISELHTILISEQTKDVKHLKKCIEKTNIYKNIQDLKIYVNDKTKFNNIKNLHIYFFDDLNQINTIQKFNIFKSPTSINDVKRILKLWDNVFLKKIKKYETKISKVIEEVITDIKIIESAYIKTYKLNGQETNYYNFYNSLTYSEYLEGKSVIQETVIHYRYLENFHFDFKHNQISETDYTILNTKTNETMKYSIINNNVYCEDFNKHCYIDLVKKIGFDKVKQTK